MEKENIFIYGPAGDTPLLVKKVVADRFGLHDRQRVDQETFKKVFIENANHMLLIINQQLTPDN